MCWWYTRHTTSALKDHKTFTHVPELTEKDVNPTLLTWKKSFTGSDAPTVYGKQLASVKAAKILSAQALLDKANGNGKVLNYFKEGRGKGKGRGRGKRPTGTSKVIPNQNLGFAQFSELDSFFFLSPAPPTNCCWCPGGLWTRSMWPRWSMNMRMSKPIKKGGATISVRRRGGWVPPYCMSWQRSWRAGSRFL